jgi:hypothetical protein
MKNLSKEELAFFRKHPELIQVVGSKATIYRLVLITVFAAGFFLVVISKIVKYSFGHGLYPWLAELTVDLVFELGVALWGGVATTVLLQDFVKRQYSEGRRYQQEIIRQLAKEQSGAEASQTFDTHDKGQT